MNIAQWAFDTAMPERQVPLILYKGEEVLCTYENTPGLIIRLEHDQRVELRGKWAYVIGRV